MGPGLSHLTSCEIVQLRFPSTSEYMQLEYQLPHLSSRKWGNCILLCFVNNVSNKKVLGLIFCQRFP
jgi:hypothetical protein